MKEVLAQELQNYMHSLLPEPKAWQTEMLAEAESEHIPIVEEEIANFLALLVKISRSKHILEIGTAIGHSAIAMAEQLDADGSLLTMDLDEERLKRAQYYFEKSHTAAKITAIKADAREYLPKMAQENHVFDLIFLDAAKGQYLNFFPYLEQILAPGGIIIADNVLLNGWVVNLDYPNQRRKTFVYRMREFLTQMKENPHYNMSLIPLGDGVLILRKKD